MAGFEVTLYGRFWVTPEGQLIVGCAPIEPQNDQRLVSATLTRFLLTDLAFLGDSATATLIAIYSPFRRPVR